MANGALMSVLQKHLALVDARSIVLHSTEGAELMAVSRGGQSSPEDLAIVGALVPSFSSSSDHVRAMCLAGNLFLVAQGARRRQRRLMPLSPPHVPFPHPLDR